MKTEKANYKPVIRSYLLDCLQSEDHNIDQPTEAQLFNYAKQRFFAEYGWQVERLGLSQAIREWLLGLAINVEYTYYDIEQKLLLWGVLSGNYSDIKREKELDLYWSRLAMVLSTEFKKA